jgi:anti-sigma regulatory factor (Ser/Thr protein kinase)
VDEVRNFTAGVAQCDDITVLALKYLCKDGAAVEVRVGESISVTLTNKLAEIERLSEIVARFGKRHDIPAKVLFALNVSLDEILTNVISYGYEDGDPHDIVVRLSFQDGEVTVEVEDDGRDYDPLNAPEPDLGKPLEERPIGGLGVHLVRTMMDRVDYRRERGKNILAIRKKVVA